jgi:DNA-binding HxlR family transcriptional regulator/rubredoxin
MEYHGIDKPKWKCQKEGCGAVIQADQAPERCPQCKGTKFRKVWKNPRGRPKRDAQNKMMEVLQLLPEDGSPVQAKMLKEKALQAGISPNTLFLYLDKLEENLAVIKKVDISERPPKVYYRRITEEELDREALRKSLLVLDRIRPKLKRLMEKVPPERLKKFYLQWSLAYFVTFPSIVVGIALELPLEKREDFIQTMMSIFFYPKLVRFSKDPWLKPEDWKNTLKEFMSELESHGISCRLPRLKLREIPKEFRSEVREIWAELNRLEAEEEANAGSP